jgi:crotonobetainyl-CoA:carnitine CoA-transferase CaiB-like acyl-CoA transferase
MMMAEMDTGHGKRQAHLDLTAGEDEAKLLDLVKGVDVFNQGFRKGTLDKRGFGPEAMAELRPGIIYVSENCYGHQGPWAERPGWEQLAQTVSGVAQLQGELAPLLPDRERLVAAGENPDVPRLAPAPMNDYSTAYFAAYGVLEALRRRATEGGSWHVQVSLTQTAMWYLRLGMNSKADLETIAPMAVETNIFSKDLRKDALYKLIEEGSGLASESGIEHFFESHDTDYGKMRHLAPVLQMSATKPYWSSGARHLGSDLPVWQ